MGFLLIVISFLLIFDNKATGECLKCADVADRCASKLVYSYSFHMRRIFIVLTGLLLPLFASDRLAAQHRPKLIESVGKKKGELIIPYQKYVLPNGLTLILTEDHSDPVVHVDVTYHVGSAREQVGKTGFAHFFEHMMFQGSDNVPNGEHFRIITEAGGTANGTTNRDRTNYYETVPKNQLEKMLWLEADRMGFLLDAVTQKKFEIQRATVKNERGQNYDNRPYGLAMEVAGKNLYPYGHPYSWQTIGYVEDLNRVGVNDLKDFFLRWYGPNNATLTIGGDIDVKQTLSWVEKYFGSIPRGPEVKNMTLPAPVLTADRYVSYEDNYAKLPLLFAVYPGVKSYHPDAVALDALSMIIGQGKNSIFYRNFIKTRKAAQASMGSYNSELAGEVIFQIVPFAGQTLQDMQKILEASFAEFEQKGVSDEDLERFKGQAEMNMMTSLSGISGKVSQLAAYQVFTGNANKIGEELAEIKKLTRDDLIRVYKKYIQGKPSVKLSILPKGSGMQPVGKDNHMVVADPAYRLPDYGYGKSVYNKAVDNFNRAVQPPAGANPVVKVPPFWTSKLSNGIDVWGAFSNEIPSTYLAVNLQGGSVLSLNDPLKAGLASVVADMLNDDTENFTSEQITSELEKMGSSIGTYASEDGITIYLSALTKNLDKSIALLEERLLRPKFTQEALDRIKKQRIQSFRIAKTQPATIASQVYDKVLYGADNIRTYALPGNEKTIEAITLDDVQKFYDQYISSNLTSAIVVGDVSEVESKKKLEFLTKLKDTQVTLPGFPSAIRPIEKNTLYLVNVPGAAQSEIRIGYLTGLNYDATGQYYRLGLANYSLGGAFNSRLNMNLRERRGWTYGAHSYFSSGKFGGSFTASAGVIAAATDSAVAEFINDLKMFALKGITPEEVSFTRSAVSQSEARKYETNQQKAAFLSRMYQYKLKPDFVNEQSRILNSITPQEINAMAAEYLSPERMTIVVVGDKVKVLPGLTGLGYRVVELDTDGKVIK